MIAGGEFLEKKFITKIVIILNYKLLLISTEFQIILTDLGHFKSFFT